MDGEQVDRMMLGILFRFKVSFIGFINVLVVDVVVVVVGRVGLGFSWLYMGI